MSIKKRGKTWHVKFQFARKTIRQSARTTSRTEALEYEKHLKAECKRIYNGGKPRFTYREAMQRFLTEYSIQLKPRTHIRYMASARNLHYHFSELNLDEIGKKVISDYKVARQRLGFKNATINRDISCLSSMLNFAADNDMIEFNPCKLIVKKKLREAPPRTRYLSPKEYDSIIAASPAYLKALIIVAVETGVRKEELLSLKWTQFNQHRNELFLTDTKNRKPRTVPVTNLARAQIQAQAHNISSPYIFNNSAGNRHTTRPFQAFKVAAKKAEVDKINWHDLRRTFGSWRLQGVRGAKMNMYEVSKVLGHSSVRVTETNYAFLAVDNLHEAMGTKIGTHESVIMIGGKNATGSN